MGTEGFSFEIVGDAGRADRAIEDVLGKLDRIAPRAQNAGREMNAVFDRASAIVEQHARALDKDAASANKFAESVAPAAEQLRRLAEQLQRDEEMLGRMHGPMQVVAQDVETLTSLLGKGAISAEEFNAKIAEMRAPSIAATGGGGGGHGDGIVGQAEGLVAKAEPFAAAAGVGMGVHELIEMSDKYTEISNKLRVVTASSADFNSVLAKTKDIALESRSDWADVASTFQRLTAVTHDLGLSQQDVLNLTQEMAEGAKISGASSQEAMMAMGELTHAFETGTLQGREYKVLMRDTPMLMHELQVASGYTSAEFANMGKHGKITAELIIDWFGKANQHIHSQFGKTVPTINEEFGNFKTNVTSAIGELAKDGNVIKAVSDSVEILSAAVAATVGEFQFWDEQLKNVGLSLGTLAGGSGVVSAIKLIGHLDYSFDGLTHALMGMSAPQHHYADQQDVINRVVAMGTGRMNEYALAQTENTIRLTLGDQAADEFAKQTSHVSAEMERAQKIATAFSDTFGEMTIGIDQASHALGQLAHALADNAQDRAYNIVGGRAAEVHNAKLQLEALTLAYKSGNYPVAYYREESQKLRDVIAGVSSASRTATKDVDALGRKLLRGESPSDRAIRSGKDERAQNAAETTWVGELYSKGSFDAAAKYKAEVEQLIAIEAKAPASIEDHAAAMKALTDEYLRAEGIFEAVNGKLSAEDKELVNLNTAMQIGAINALQYAKAVSELENAAAAKSRAEQRKKYESASSGYDAMVKEADAIVKKEAAAAQKTREAWATAFTDMTMSLINGQKSWRDWANAAVEAIERAIVKMLVLKAIEYATGGASAPASGPLGSLLGGGGGGGAPGFATGGDMIMGGSGRPDSKLAMWWMSPGESAHIRTPDQRRQAANENGGSGGNITITPLIKILPAPSRRDIVDTSRNGLTNLVHLMQDIPNSRR